MPEQLLIGVSVWSKKEKKSEKRQAVFTKGFVEVWN